MSQVEILGDMGVIEGHKLMENTEIIRRNIVFGPQMWEQPYQIRYHSKLWTIWIC